MFAKPKKAATGSSTPGRKAAAGTRTNAVPARPKPAPAARSQSSTSVASSTVRKQTAASVARKAATERKPTPKKVPPVLSSKEDRARSEAEEEAALLKEAHEEYLRAELIRLRAKDEYFRTKEAAEKECAVMWTAASQERNALMEVQWRRDRLDYLADYVARKHGENVRLEELAEALPEAAERLEALAGALSASQDYLRVKGAAGRAGDGPEMEAALSAVWPALSSLSAEVESRSGKAVQMAAEVGELRLAMERLSATLARCGEMATELEDEAVREESLEIGARSKDGKSGAMMRLKIPPQVPEPKLVDI